MSYWRIHNNFYDLTDFMHIHPGGVDLLETSRNMEDVTPMFESYHAMKDIDRIERMMIKYKIPEEKYDEYHIVNKNVKQYDFTNYRILTKSVREMMNNDYKAGLIWYSKMIPFTILYLFTYYVSFFTSNTYTNIMMSIICGLLFVIIYFCIMHDASHNGLFHDSKKNGFLSRIMNSWGLWNHAIWERHHCYGHHSFTGEYGRDPDTLHYHPFIVKNRTDKLNNIFTRNQDKLHMIIMFIFPGQYVGQCMSYVRGYLRGSMWRVKLNVGNDITKYEKIIYLTSLTLLMISFMFYTSYGVVAYLIALNIGYSLCIFPDHDTFENAIEEKEDFDDWMVQQISKSGNFCNNNDYVGYLFGGINYQIEHHLFPTVYHGNYKKISVIVKKYCLENNIRYTHHETLYDAYKSYYKMIKYTKPFNSSNNS